MSSLVGFANLKENIPNKENIVMNMTKALSKRCSGKDFFYTNKHIYLGNGGLLELETKTKQPMCLTYHENTYTVVYDGNLYNIKEIQEELVDNGFEVENSSVPEVILKAFIVWGYDAVNKFNGVFSFAIWNESKQELFLARDRFGIKPLYYTIVDNTFIFASEIKALIEHPLVELSLDATGFTELLGIGPAHTPGLTVFKNIYEIKPAHFIIYNHNGLSEKEYWKLESKPHTDDFETTCNTVRYLLNDSIKRQLVSDLPICSMLSGGLDSSIITAYISNYYKENNLPKLNTYSVDYVDNDKNFIKSDFQPNSDNYYIDIMLKNFETNHHKVIIDTPELANALEDAMIARDFPGMADVDSSMLLFCRKIKEGASVAISRRMFR